ncbi:DUF397 domain-containing protein [Streptomyces sp. NBC_00878]|uniref:DUF397 domain-containing protein n=1 Tax=Streptomyces sp. NBC_00878 TaxID=2975854 RepID=UPI00225A1EA0|nr:DUF397 domain-containing protein [Streptomyces sp. NBC_00878]MCX4909801.1 DUF397 domain-containing protein [Streptomyces sp. NBC_00878]
MIDRDLSERVWTRSSYSQGNQECVEMAVESLHVLIRDSNWRRGSKLAFRRAAWCGFLAGLVYPGTDGS